MVTNIKVYLLSDYWAAGTAQLKLVFVVSVKEAKYRTEDPEGGIGVVIHLVCKK